MKTAKARLMINELGSDLPVAGITPAEAVVLGTIHLPNVKEYPLTEVEETGEVDRTPLQERNRLMAKYGRKLIKELFPGAIPQFPTSFAEAKDALSEIVGEGQEDVDKGADITGAKAAYAEALSKLPKEE